MFVDMLSKIIFNDITIRWCKYIQKGVELVIEKVSEIPSNHINNYVIIEFFKNTFKSVPHYPKN